MKKQEVDINININVNDERGLQTLGKSNHFRLETDLSVSQLAYFFKLMYITKGLRVKNQTDILKFISHCFQTSNTSNISFSSLRTKYYNVDTSTRERVKQILQEMIELAAKEDNS